MTQRKTQCESVKRKLDQSKQNFAHSKFFDLASDVILIVNYWVQIENLEIVENYEEDSFEIEDEDDEDLLVDGDDDDLEHQMGAKESTPSETGMDRLID